MGFTYQEFRRIGNSIVLEKQENIEVQQNSTTFCRKKKSLIRELFYRDTKIHNEPCKTELSKYSECISRVLFHSLPLQKEEYKGYEQKVNHSSVHLKNLEQTVNDEIKKLQQQRQYLIMEKKRGRRKLLRYDISQKKKGKEKEEDITWSENLAGNSLKERRSDIANERHSVQHRGRRISPCYGTNKDMIIRLRTHTVGSHIETLNNGTDKGAVGDYNSIKGSKYNMVDKASYGVKEALLTPSIHSKNDKIIDCCYMNSNTAHTTCECCGMERNAKGIICHHHNFQQSVVQPHREYNYCCNEYYYDSSNFAQKPTCSCCKAQCAKHLINKGYEHHGTNLNTENFYCNPKNRSRSTKSHSKYKCQRTTKTNIETEEYGERKQRECKERQSRKQEKSRRKSSEEVKLHKVLNEKLRDKSISKLVEYLDRYVDDHKNCFDGFFENCPSTTPTTIKINSKSKISHITAHRKPTACDNKGETVNWYEDISLKSQYSVETLRMLKKMKIRKYEAVKPVTIRKEKDKKSMDNDEEKMKKYQEYLQQYKTNDQNRISKEELKILKKPPLNFEQSESESLSQQVQTSYTIKEQKKTTYRHQESTEKPLRKQRNVKPFPGGESYGELQYEMKKLENIVGKEREFLDSEYLKLARKKDIADDTEIYKGSNDYKEESNNRREIYKEAKYYKRELNGTTENTRMAKNKNDFDNGYSKTVYEHKPDTKVYTGSKNYKRESIDRSDSYYRDRRRGNEEQKYRNKNEAKYKIGQEKNNSDAIRPRQSERLNEENYERKHNEDVKYKIYNKTNDRIEYDIEIKDNEPQIKKEDKEKYLEVQREDSIQSKPPRSDNMESDFRYSGDFISNQKHSIKDCAKETEQCRVKTHCGNQENLVYQRSYSNLKDIKSYTKDKLKSVKESNNTFDENLKATIDYNLGFHVERSIQTDCISESEIIQVESNKTFIKEFDQDKSTNVKIENTTNTEEILKYLKSFLNTYQTYQQCSIEGEYFKSVTKVGEDLNNKLSFCNIMKTLSTVENASDMIEHKLSENISEIILKNKIATDTQYKDPETTPHTNCPQLEQEAKATCANIQIDSMYTDDFRDEIVKEQEYATPIPTYNSLKEKSYHQNYLKDQHQQRHIEYEENITFLTPPIEFIDDTNTSQMPNREQHLDEVVELPLTYSNTQTNISLHLRPYNNDNYYQYLKNLDANISLTKSVREEPSNCMEILPIKGILKPCRTIESGQKVSCDLISNKKTSAVSFEQQDHLNVRRETLITCSLDQERIDENMHPIEQHSNLKCTKSTIRHHLYQDDKGDDSCMGYGEENKRFLYTVDMPSFKQCPCMLDIYLQMLETYYRGGNK